MAERQMGHFDKAVFVRPHIEIDVAHAERSSLSAVKPENVDDAAVAPRAPLRQR